MSEEAKTLLMKATLLHCQQVLPGESSLLNTGHNRAAASPRACDRGTQHPAQHRAIWKRPVQMPTYGVSTPEEVGMPSLGFSPQNGWKPRACLLPVSQGQRKASSSCLVWRAWQDPLPWQRPRALPKPLGNQARATFRLELSSSSTAQNVSTKTEFKNLPLCVQN